MAILFLPSVDLFLRTTVTIVVAVVVVVVVVMVVVVAVIAVVVVVAVVGSVVVGVVAMVAGGGVWTWMITWTQEFAKPVTKSKKKAIFIIVFLSSMNTL